MATMLYGTELPPYGGDTLFADMGAAWRALSDGMKRMLDGLVAVFSNEVPSQQPHRSAAVWTGASQNDSASSSISDRVIEQPAMSREVT